jgi:hypothetical protein
MYIDKTGKNAVLAGGLAGASIAGPIGAVVGVVAGVVVTVAAVDLVQTYFSKPTETKPDSCAGNPDKPEGVLDDWIEKPSAKGGGTEWVNPENPNDRVRVMPGNPDSPNPSQKGPYVVDQNGGFRDVNGDPIGGPNPGKTPEAHIPYDDFKFRR